LVCVTDPRRVFRAFSFTHIPRGCSFFVKLKNLSQQEFMMELSRKIKAMKEDNETMAKTIQETDSRPNEIVEVSQCKVD
jgi:hypothetical protein